MEVTELPRLHRGPLASGRPQVRRSVVLLVFVLRCGLHLRVDAEEELDELGEGVEVEEL